MIVYRRDHALLFEGGHVEVGAHADFDLTTALTFAAWVRPTTGSGLQATILSKHYTAYEPQVQNSRLVFERGPEYASSAGNPVVLDRWVHLAVTFDAGAESDQLRLYIDGELDAAHTVADPLTVTTHPLLIGMRPGWNSGLFGGWMAGIALWSSAHSAWRIKQEMNSRPDPGAADLVAYWAMDDGEGEQVSDRSPRGHHGTLRGAVSWVTLDAPITVATPGRETLLALEPAAPPPQVPADAVALRPAPRATLPPSGRNGAARTFLDRVSLHAQQQIQAQREGDSARIQRAKESGAGQRAAAHQEAARRMNSTRFDALWFIHRRAVHRVDPQGRVTPFRIAGPQGLGPAAEATVVTTPTVLQVDARTPWMRTGVQVSPEVRVRLAAGSTLWTISPQDQNLTAAGTTRFVAPAGYALPGAPPGALVGRVGDRAFLVGTGATVPAGLSGELELAANDDLEQRMGAGYTDNSGSMRVEVQREALSPALAACLAVDPARGRVFWALPHLPFSLRSAAVDGSGDEQVLVATPDGPVASLALDLVNQRVFYFTADGRLFRVGYGGGAPQLLLTATGPSADHAWDLAVDNDHGRLYWTGPGGIFAATLDGLSAGLVVHPHQAPVPVGVAVDPDGGRIFWLDRELRRLRRAALDGTGAEDLYAVEHPVPGLTLDEVTPDSGLVREVYWSAREERVTRRTPGIAGYWPLDEGEGRTLANRVRPADARSHLGAFRRTGDDLPPPLRPPARAVVLQGPADSLRLPQGYAARFVDRSFTVEMWVRPRSAAREQGLLWLGEAVENQGLHLLIREGKPYFGFYGNDTPGATPLRDDTWAHLAFRYDRDRQEQAVFVNGRPDAAATGRAPLQADPALPLLLGRGVGGTGDFFAGAVAGLHIADRALSDAEIAAGAAGGKPGDVLDEVPDDPVWTIDDAPPVALRPEAVLAFSGGGYARLGSAPALGLTGSSFTVECWVRPDTVDGDVAILGTDEMTQSQGLHLLIRGGKPYLGFYGDDVAGTAALAAGAWVHLAWRFDAATREQTILVNGVVDARRTAGAAFAGEGTVFLGRALVDRRLTGAVSELRIWGVARSDAEIARNVKGYREQFALRGPVDGSAAPEHLFEVPSEGGLALVSKLSAGHEQRLLAYRARKEAQAKAAAEVAAAHAAADGQVAARNAELERTHRESAAAVAAKAAAHEQERADSRTRVLAAQGAATQRVDAARQDAARKRSTAQGQAADIRNRANADAAAMKSRAQAERDRARAARDSHR